MYLTDIGALSVALGCKARHGVFPCRFSLLLCSPNCLDCLSTMTGTASLCPLD